MDNSANFEALKAATLGADAISAPTSTLGASNAPELANLYKSTFQLPQSSGSTSAAANVSGDIVAQQRAAAAAAAQAAAEAKQKAADLQDLSKYRVQQKDDGGYDFFAPDGSQVDIATLSQRTGVKPVDILFSKTLGTDSQNPIDIQYAEDQKNLNDYIRAKLSNNTAKIKQYETSQPDLSQYQGQGGAHNLINKFQQTYQRYYVPRSVDTNAWGTNPGSPVVGAAQTGNNYGVSDTSGGI